MRIFLNIGVTETDHPHVHTCEDDPDEIHVLLADGVSISGSRDVIARWANELQMGVNTCV